MALLLVTNDDGVHAAGLAALAGALADLGDVHVIAPEREQSACGHALTLHRPLRVVEIRDRWFAVNGTPSDCVNLGVLGFLPERPVLVVSGINHGSNLGDDVTYSGTVSAAMESTLLGVPSLAVSLVDGGDFDIAASVARIVAIDAKVDPTTRNSLGRARVAGAAPTPGASVRVEVPVGPATRAVAIPVSALRKGPGGDFVFAIQADSTGKARAHVQPVRSGPVVDDQVLILEGLAAGTQVATSGSFKLRESVLVAVAAPSDAKKE